MDAIDSDNLILDFMEVVRKRPGMYCYPYNLRSLATLLVGFSSGCRYSLKEQCYFDKQNVKFFGDWIFMKESTDNILYDSWDKAIADNTICGEKQIDRFFEHLDSYMCRKFIVLEELQINETSQTVIDRIVSYDESVEGVFLQSELITKQIYFKNITQARDYFKTIIVPRSET